MKTFPLYCAPIGKKVKLLDIDLVGSPVGRLKQLGFLPGAEIIPLQKSIWGDPRAYYIRGLVIALRGCDAKKILVCGAEECE